MKLTAKGFFLAVLVALALAPVLSLPRLSTHEPTIAAASTPASTSRSIEDLSLWPLGVMGSIRIKDVNKLAQKFVQRAGGAAGEYMDGVKGAGADWEANTAAAEDNYKAGVNEANARGAFGKGVRAAGSAKYVGRASTLGAQRFPTGVAAAEGEWSKNTQPYLQTIAGLNLPPRRPKGDPANQQRAAAVAMALRKQKVGAA